MLPRRNHPPDLTPEVYGNNQQRKTQTEQQQSQTQFRMNGSQSLHHQAAANNARPNTARGQAPTQQMLPKRNEDAHKHALTCKQRSKPTFSIHVRMPRRNDRTDLTPLKYVAKQTAKHTNAETPKSKSRLIIRNGSQTQNTNTS